MLSARDLYCISNQLSKVFNTPEESFGGLNMVFSGDFTQLPPAVGCGGYCFTHNQLELLQVVWNPKKKQLEKHYGIKWQLLWFWGRIWDKKFRVFWIINLELHLKTCAIKLAHLKILDFHKLVSLQIYPIDHLFVMTNLEMFLL